MANPALRALTPTTKLRLLRPGTVAVAGWSIISAIAILAYTDGSTSNFRTQFAGMTIILTGYGYTSARLMSGHVPLARSLSTLKLGPWFGIGFGIVFGPMSFVWLQPIRPNLITDESALLTAQWIVLVGLVIFVVGYLAAPRWLVVPTRTRNALPPTGPTAAAVLAVWLIALASPAYSIATGSFGYLDPNATVAATTSLPQLLALIQNLGFLASLMAGWRLAQRRTMGARVLTLVVVASQIGLGLFAGQKEPALVQMVAVFAGYATLRRIKVRWILASVAAFVIIIIPFVTLYRTEVTTGTSRLSPSQALAQVSFGSLAENAGQTSASQSWVQFAQRLSRIGDVALIVQKTPSVLPFVSPAELVEAPVLGVVPRSIWAGKPVNNAGLQMAQQYYGTTANTAAAVTPEGDLWRHGGRLPLIIGMLVLGILVTSIDRRRGNAVVDPRVMFLPMLLFSGVVKEEADFVGLVAGLAGIFILSAATAWFVGAVSRESFTMSQARVRSRQRKMLRRRGPITQRPVQVIAGPARPRPSVRL